MHTLICGVSLSGKSTMARKLAKLYSDAGREIIVLDELMDPAWQEECDAALLTDDETEFSQVFWASRSLVFVIDEAGESVGRYNKSMSMTATRGRHWGHIGIYIVQQPAMISRQVRGQCSQAYIFACDEDDADVLARAFLAPELKQAPLLARGEYYHVKRFGKDNRPEIKKGKIF